MAYLALSPLDESRIKRPELFLAALEVDLVLVRLGVVIVYHVLLDVVVNGQRSTGQFSSSRRHRVQMIWGCGEESGAPKLVSYTSS